MIHTRFRVPREVSGKLGPFQLVVLEVGCTVTLDYAPERTPVPAGRASGAGAIVEIEHAPKVSRFKADGSYDEAAVAAEVVEVVVPAINRVIHTIALVGESRQHLPELSRFDLEDVVCEDRHDASPRQVNLGQLLVEGRIRVKEPPAAKLIEVQKRLDDAPKEFTEAEGLWLDSVEAFYDGRPREAIILLRAAIEVGWHAAFDQAAEAYRRCTWGPPPVALLDSIVERAKNKRTPVPQQLDEYSKTVFGFSFRKDWEPGKSEKWDRLNSFFDERHAVAHRTGAPSTEKLWEALSLTREVLDKVRDLAAGVVASCPAPGPPSP